MNNLTIGSIQCWLAMAGDGFGPLAALILGFVGTDRLLRRQLRGKEPHISVEGPERDDSECSAW